MLTREKNEKETTGRKKGKDLCFQFITVVVLAALALLLLNVLSLDKDGRRQIVDNDGPEEYIGSSSDHIQTAEEKRLAGILTQIKGVGAASVMITWHDEEKTASVFSSDQNTEQTRVKGVIVTAEGAGDAVTKNNIVKAVSAVFNIPAANVMVFESETGGN